MAISGDYSTPVQVNGYSCRNCTDVDYAKKHIDPAHPKDGPYGVSAPPERDPAVRLGGLLGDERSPAPALTPGYRPGAGFDLSA